MRGRQRYTANYKALGPRPSARSRSVLGPQGLQLPRRQRTALLRHNWLLRPSTPDGDHHQVYLCYNKSDIQWAKRLKFHIICLSDSVKLGASTKARRVILSAGPGPTPGRPDPVQACAASGLAGGGSNWVSSVIHCAITVQHVCTVRRASHQRAATTAASATAAAGKPAAPQRRRRAGLEDAKAGERIGPYTASTQTMKPGGPGPL